MSKLALLTNPVESRINGKNTLLYVVQGLAVGTTLLRAAGVEVGTPDGAFVNKATSFEMQGLDPKRQLRITDFFVDTQIKRKVRNYNGHTFVSYVMGWSDQMNKSNVHNTGLPGYVQAGRIAPGKALGIVQHTDRSILAPARGSHKQSVLGVDGSDKILTVPRENQPLVVMHASDALRCFSGNNLYMLRSEN